MPIESVLFLFAHQDDEYAISSRIEFEIQNGNEVFCTYLTDGSGNNSDPSVRNRESLQVLAKLGVPEKNVDFVGCRLGVRDGRLADNLSDCLVELRRRWGGATLHRVYAMAWEGGHVDHDAAHLLALALSKELGILDNTLQFSIYNGHNTPWKLFRVLSPLPFAREERRKLAPLEGLKYALLCCHYGSQWKTWLGLFPEGFVKLAVLRREAFQKVDISKVSAPPHPGKLLYERLFGASAQGFMNRTLAFRESLTQSE